MKAFAALRYRASFLAVVVLCQPVTAQEDSSEYLVIREPDWRYPAYFMTAPRRIADAMSRFVANLCEGYEASYGLDVYVQEFGDADWLCEREDIYFYRGVDGWGRRVRSGFTCQYQLGVSGQNYFGDSRFADFGCIFMLWNDESQDYEIDFQLDEE